MIFSCVPLSVSEAFFFGLHLITTGTLEPLGYKLIHKAKLIKEKI